MQYFGIGDFGPVDERLHVLNVIEFRSLPLPYLILIQPNTTLDINRSQGTATITALGG
jgi:hypothetical protein